MTEWQTIETALFTQPILASWITSDGRRCVGQVWRQLESVDVESDLSDIMGLNRIMSFWSFDYDGEDLLTYTPTHWMPLPEPPALVEKK